ncbi:MAG: histidinol dehydrogenase [Treponema sp.]|nr:histidinol dehydrogenase [Treponema sp.]
MGLLKIITGKAFAENPSLFLAGGAAGEPDAEVTATVSGIISAVRVEGDTAVRRYAALFEKESPRAFEVPLAAAEEAWETVQSGEPELAAALSFAADNIRRFAELQKEQFKDFEEEIQPGVFAGQRVIPVDRAAIYVPSGRFPLISSALMGLIPAAAAGVGERILVSPPAGGGAPDRRILAAARIAGASRIFALGGAQAIAALAIGTETVPRADIIAGPGNKYVATAKRLLFGEVGIDFVAGPTDLLVISDGKRESAAGSAPPFDFDLIAADMLAQAEHDPDARVRALVPDRQTAEHIELALSKRLALLPTEVTARASLNAGGLIIIYESREEAIRIANAIAPEHLALSVASPEEWAQGLRNYGSLFTGSAAAEALGDYSAGINHTLPTSGSSRFTGGLSVRNFLKTVTTLRCVPGEGYTQALRAAEIMARAEGLAGHAESAAVRAAPGGSKKIFEKNSQKC